jgi:hypothetical protein
MNSDKPYVLLENLMHKLNKPLYYKAFSSYAGEPLYKLVCGYCKGVMHGTEWGCWFWDQIEDDPPDKSKFKHESTCPWKQAHDFLQSTLSESNGREPMLGGERSATDE